MSVRVTGAADAPGGASAQVVARLRGSLWEWSTGGDCVARDGALRCDFAETGSTAILSIAGTGLRLEVAGGRGLTLDAEGHENNQERTLKTLSLRDDGVFLLAAAPTAVCK